MATHLTVQIITQHDGMSVMALTNNVILGSAPQGQGRVSKDA